MKLKLPLKMLSIEFLLDLLASKKVEYDELNLFRIFL